jgi:hypothetical protein
MDLPSRVLRSPSCINIGKSGSMSGLCYVHMSGRLGNQLFQIANGYAHSKRHGYTMVLPPKGSTHWTTYLHNCRSYLQKEEMSSQIIRWIQPGFGHSPIPADAQYLEGYVQSSKFFADVSGEIRALFQPPVSIQKYVHTKYVNLIQRRDNIVVIHIRRGDYFFRRNSIHGILTSVYYTRAIAAARESIPNAEFIVFSDDNRWCSKQPWLKGATLIDERNDCNALYLMTQFRNFIISNSTYSWWGAWLSDPAARVWAPASWFSPNGPKDYEDVYEPSWVRIPIR